MAEFFSKGVFTPFVHLSVTPVSLSIFFNVPVGISLDGWFDIGTLYPVGLTASMAYFSSLALGPSCIFEDFHHFTRLHSSSSKNFLFTLYT